MMCSYDENPVIWLNGHQLWAASGWNDNNYATLELSAEQKGWLREGDNVLAVSVKQGGGGGHVDFGLKTVKSYVPAAVNALVVNTRKNARDNRYFDLSGRYVGNSPHGFAKGIYINNGKKIIVK